MDRRAEVVEHAWHSHDSRDTDGGRGSPVIVTEHLSKSYEGKTAIDDLNLHVEPGEILGFLGPNGAGKSTTVKILTGMLRPSNGRAIVAGFDVVAEPLEVKRRVG